MAEARQSLVWHGEAITEKMRAAQKTGVNQTMSGCVVEAKNNHSWQNRTGILEGGISLVDQAREDGDGVVGIWGVTDNAYALIQELGGTIGPILPKDKKALRFLVGGKAVFATRVNSITIPARPYLRPAADKIYPSLADRIRKAYDGQAAVPNG